MHSHNPGKPRFARKKYPHAHREEGLSVDSTGSLGLDDAFRMPETVRDEDGVATAEERLTLDAAREILNRLQEKSQPDS